MRMSFCFINVLSVEGPELKEAASPHWKKIIYGALNPSDPPVPPMRSGKVSSILLLVGGALFCKQTCGKLQWNPPSLLQGPG